METLVALILAGLLFRTPEARMWVRLLVIVDVVVACVYDFTPLRTRLGAVWSVCLIATAVLWAVDLVRARRTPREGMP